MCTHRASVSNMLVRTYVHSYNVFTRAECMDISRICTYMHLLHTMHMKYMYTYIHMYVHVFTMYIDTMYTQQVEKKERRVL